MAVESQADVIGDGGIGQLEGLLLAVRQREFVKKDDNVRQYKKGVDDRVGPARVQVFERDEHTVGLVARQLWESCAVSLALVLQLFDSAQFRNPPSRA